MIIHSLEFFGYTAALLVLYYLMPTKKQNYLLLIASYIFFITISWHFALVLMIMTIGNYIFGKKIEAENQIKKWLWIGIGFNLVVLFFFKSANFFVTDILNLLSHLGLRIQTAGLKILLPIGLSFYVLQAISYLVDVYRKQMSACSSPVDFAIYLAYFPKLTAGPIERARNFLPKLEQRRVVDNELLSRSFTLIIIGLVRKVVISDTLLTAIPAKVFETPLEFSSIELLSWLIAYAFGLYNDFCGYTNIVRGISGFFGIELSRNFNNPFFSRNFSEFWNRWHRTLTLWLRDYIYFPISRVLVRRNPRQNNLANIILPPIVTMLASGLWHGMGLNFLAWGGLMGIFLIGERLLSLGKPIVFPDQKPVWIQVSGMMTVLILLHVSLIVFLADFSILVQFFQSLFTNTQWILPDSRVFIVIIPSLWIDFLQYRSKNELVFLSKPLLSRSCLLAVAVLVIFLFSQSKMPTPFIYQGF